MKNSFGKVAKVGKALMLPVAVLPIAALLLRLGAGDVFDLPFMFEAGNAIFANLALLFAIGIAIGLAKDNHGAAALAGAVSYLTLTAGAKAINADINMGVLAGILAGLLASYFYNKYHDIELPAWLGFFGGKRFVPIITGLVSILIAYALGYIWPSIQNGLDALGYVMVNGGVFGAFSFGFLNRLLIPTGLHHVLNSIFWFVFGEFGGATGDLGRFFAGDPSAGVFMTGFYPVMMFGLPAAALAMYTTARKENKAKVGGLLVSVALPAFLTGITEPIEFLFMFLAPVLYAIHALLTGVSMALTYVLGIRHGFGFSAGAIDYFLNMGLATKGWLLIPIGLIFAVLYYLVFVAVIKGMDLPTPGREEDADEEIEERIKSEGISGLAKDYLKALGGKENLEDIDACITRLRLTVKNGDLIKDENLKALGASGVIRPTAHNIQVVVGTKAEIIAGEMKKL
ncbi:MAG TPA: N-acetylglucosamine-specific PTS transporter subunit IIBC [Clostridia bacterium]|nr:N-acetylglucosamine-specific PTS transporter subunit IIBC [Clostridia bacterium]